MDREDVIRYCLTLPGAYEDRPFEGDIDALRHKGNKKSFAFLLFAHGRLHLNLKCEPMRADFLRQIYSGVIPGYHMNKVHWNSVFLDDDVPEVEIKSMIDHSYELTRPRVRSRSSALHTFCLPIAAVLLLEHQASDGLEPFLHSAASL